MAAAGESTLADYPRIVSWWHPTKNGERLPADYTHGSGKRVWLQCPGCLNCGEVHEWDVRTANLTRSGGDIRCPFCVPTAGLFCSCRAISANERLAAQWHEDNPSPATIHQGSTKKFKWRCLDAACGHIWEAKPEDRTRAGGTNCPKCAMKRFSKGVKHPCVAVGRPELLAEWDEEKNTLLPTEVSCGSDKKVWWLCKVCEWSWQARVCNRAQRKTGCPKCRSSS